MLKKTGTHLHTSAAAHARTVVSNLDKYEVDEQAMRRALPPAQKLTPSIVVHEDAQPTQVVQMEIDDQLVSDLSRELTLRSQIDKTISSVASGTYFPLSTQFENSVLFLPSAQRFYRRNKHIVQSKFPDVHTVTVNAFIVRPNTQPYGAHNAGSIGFQVPALARRGFAYAKKHISFHTALTPTPLERQPLCVFEDAVAESPNTSFLYEAIRSYSLTPEEVASVEKAFYLHDSGRLSALDLTPIRDYLLCVYWSKKYAETPELSAGYYADLKPGQAVFFDNYRPHGDSTLPPSLEPRITIDMRCFSTVEYPSKAIRSGVDLLLDASNKERQKDQKRAAIECLTMLLGYEDIGEFMQLVYGTKNVDAFDITTDMQYSIYNAGEHYVLERDLEPHYEKVARVYDQIERDGEFVPSPKAQAAMDALASA